jgi:hypothetical protein
MIVNCHGCNIEMDTHDEKCFPNLEATERSGIAFYVCYECHYRNIDHQIRLNRYEWDCLMNQFSFVRGIDGLCINSYDVNFTSLNYLLEERSVIQELEFCNAQYRSLLKEKTCQVTQK